MRTAVGVNSTVRRRAGWLRASLGARVFYGWVNVGAATCMVAAAFGVVLSFAVFVEPLAQAFGASRSAISLAYSINMVIFGISAVVMSALSDRVGVRLVAIVGGAFFPVGLALATSATSLWGLYLTFGVVAAIGVGSLHGPLVYLTAKWFDRRKGLATGIVLSGAGLGIMVAAPLARALIAWGGWRTAFFGMAVLALITILCMGALLCDTPEDLGQAPDGIVGPTARLRDDVCRWTSKTALQTRSYWILLGSFFFCCASHSGPVLHVAAHASGIGMSTVASAGVLSIFGAFSIAGRVGMGFVADRIGGKRTLLLSLVFQGAGALWLAFAREAWAFYAFATGFGIAYGGVYAQFPVITREYFGATKVGAVFGSQVMLSQVGMAIGGYGVGALFDVTGSYRDPFLASAFSGVLALALAFGLARPRPPAARGQRAAETNTVIREPA